MYLAFQSSSSCGLEFWSPPFSVGASASSKKGRPPGFAAPQGPFLLWGRGILPASLFPWPPSAKAGKDTTARAGVCSKFEAFDHVRVSPPTFLSCRQSLARAAAGATVLVPLCPEYSVITVAGSSAESPPLGRLGFLPSWQPLCRGAGLPSPPLLSVPTLHTAVSLSPPGFSVLSPFYSPCPCAAHCGFLHLPPCLSAAALRSHRPVFILHVYLSRTYGALLFVIYSGDFFPSWWSL